MGLTPSPLRSHEVIPISLDRCSSHRKRKSINKANLDEQTRGRVFRWKDIGIGRSLAVLRLHCRGFVGAACSSSTVHCLPLAGRVQVRGSSLSWALRFVQTGLMRTRSYSSALPLPQLVHCASEDSSFRRSAIKDNDCLRTFGSRFWR